MAATLTTLVEFHRCVLDACVPASGWDNRRPKLLFASQHPECLCAPAPRFVNHGLIHSDIHLGNVIQVRNKPPPPSPRVSPRVSPVAWPLVAPLGCS